MADELLPLPPPKKQQSNEGDLLPLPPPKKKGGTVNTSGFQISTQKDLVNPQLPLAPQALTPEKQAEFVKPIMELSNRLKGYQSAYDSVQGKGKSERINAAAKSQPEGEIKTPGERKGNRIGYVYNQILNGVGSLANAVNETAIVIGTSIPGAQQEGDFTVDDYRQNVAPYVRNYLTEAIGANVDEGRKQKYDQEFLTSAIGGLGYSAPAMLGGRFATPAMILQAVDSASKSITESDTENKISPEAKTIYSWSIGLALGKLEKIGFDRIFKSQTSSVATNLINKAIQSAADKGEKITGDYLTKFINTEVKDLAGKYSRVGLKALEGAVAEGVTGSAQEGVTIGGENIVNKLADDKIFDTQDLSKWSGIVDAVKRVGYAGAQEAVGGGLLGTVAAFTDGTRRTTANELRNSINTIDQQLDSEGLNPTTEEVLTQQRVKIQNQLDDVVDQELASQKDYTPEQKQRAVEINEQLDKIEQTLSDPAISEEVKATLTSEVDGLNKELADLPNRTDLDPVQATIEPEPIQSNTEQKQEPVEAINESNLLTDEEAVSQRAEVDDAIRKFQENNPNIEVDPLDDLPDSVVRTFDRVENNLPTDPVAVKETSEWLYNKYKQLTDLKNDPNRRLTTDQIEFMQEQLGEDITTLENYIQNQNGEGQGTQTAAEPRAEQATEEVQPTPQVNDGTNQSQEIGGQQTKESIPVTETEVATPEAQSDQLPTEPEVEQTATEPIGEATTVIKSYESTTSEEKKSTPFDELAYKSLETDLVRNTLSNVERETGSKLDKDIKEYKAEDRRESFRRGIEIVDQAKKEFGKEYVSKTIDYVNESKMPNENKALILISLENDLRKQLLADPENTRLRKQVNLATKASVDFGRGVGRAVGMGALRRAARADYHTEQAVEALFSPQEIEARNKIQQAVESTVDDVQEEYERKESQGEQGVSEDIQNAIDEGVEKRINEIYESLPTRRRQAADKAIKALDNIQKKLRGKTYDATIGVPVSIIDAGITTIKAAIRAGVNIADAIELGIKKIKDQYGKKWDKEDDFRNDMLKGFESEGINEKVQKEKQLTLRKALAEAGYGKEITVTTKQGKEKRNVLDWKKLLGSEGSFDNLNDAVEKLKDKGYSDHDIKDIQEELKEEYSELQADIVNKSLNELQRRNTPKDGKQKILARRLVDLYNLGVYDQDVNTYSNILNNALGVTPKSQKAFNEIRDFNKSLAQLLESRGFGEAPLSDVALSRAETEIKNHINRVIQAVQFAEGNMFFKASVVFKNIFSAMQRTMLNRMTQLVENPISGKIDEFMVKLQDAFSKDNWTTKELRDKRRLIGRAMYKDTSINSGGEYGGVGNPFTSRNAIEDFINGLSKNALYQAVATATSGKFYLDSADSYFKIKRTEHEFVKNLIRVLTDKSNPNGTMSHEDALKYVSETLTGQNFEDAKNLARTIIGNINKDAGKELIRGVESNVILVANDLIKDSLVTGGKITAGQVESAFKAAYKTAGKSIGHESNNILTDGLSMLNQTIQQKYNEAVKRKDWTTAAWLNMTAILSKNIVFPFVGGGTNWTVIGLQKMGFPTEYARADVGKDYRPIDLSTKDGQKMLEKNLAANAMRQRMHGRMVVGTFTALTAVMALKYSGYEDEYEKWLKKHPETAKVLKRIQPNWLTIYMALDEKSSDLIKAVLDVIGRRPNYDSDKLLRASKDFLEGYDKGSKKKTERAWGAVGEIIGRRTNLPYLSAISNFGESDSRMYKEFVGEYSKEPYKASKGFLDGYFKGGLADYIGISPKDIRERK